MPDVPRRGRERRTKRYTVRIPAGVKDGTKIKLKGKGEAGWEELPPASPLPLQLDLRAVLDARRGPDGVALWCGARDPHPVAGRGQGVVDDRAVAAADPGTAAAGQKALAKLATTTVPSRFGQRLGAVPGAQPVP